MSPRPKRAELNDYLIHQIINIDNSSNSSDFSDFDYSGRIYRHFCCLEYFPLEKMSL